MALVVWLFMLWIFQTNSFITWRTKSSSNVLSKTSNFEGRLKKEKVNIWRESKDLDRKLPLSYYYNLLPVKVNQRELSSFIEETKIFNSAQTKFAHFWVDTSLKEGSLEWIVFEYSRMDNQLRYYAAKASLSIPENGEWREDCKKKVKTFKTTTTCNKHFVSYGLTDDQLNLIKNKLQNAIKSQDNYKRIKRIEDKIEYVFGTDDSPKTLRDFSALFGFLFWMALICRILMDIFGILKLLFWPIIIIWCIVWLILVCSLCKCSRNCFANALSGVQRDLDEFQKRVEDCCEKYVASCFFTCVFSGIGLLLCYLYATVISVLDELEQVDIKDVVML